MKPVKIFYENPQAFIFNVFILSLILTGVGAAFFYFGNVVIFNQCATDYLLGYQVLLAGLLVMVVDFFVMVHYSVSHRKKWNGNKKIGGMHVVIALAFTMLTASPVVSVFLSCKTNFLDNGVAIVFVITVLLGQAFFICLFALFVAVLTSLRENHER